MRATFFRATRTEAMGVESSDTLPDEPCGEPLRITRLDAVRALAEAMDEVPEKALTQVVDTTCRTFPIWALARSLTTALAEADEDSIDRIAAAWQARVEARAMDADLYELTLLLGELRIAASSLDADDARLFVLLEETAD